MRSGGAEQDLVAAQFEHRIGIFGCDGFAVLSDAAMRLGRTDLGEVQTWLIPIANASLVDEPVAGTAFKSHLNARTFVAAWDALLQDGQLWMHDWAVKADPDTVFFVDRLRLHLMPRQGSSLYFQTCQPEGADYPLLAGPLEIFSHKALEIYAAGQERCKSEYRQWEGWSEAKYMQTCLDFLGVGHEFDRMLLGDDRCEASSCSDWTRVAFHPYKAPGEYLECFRSSLDPTMSS